MNGRDYLVSHFYFSYAKTVASSMARHTSSIKAAATLHAALYAMGKSRTRSPSATNTTPLHTPTYYAPHRSPSRLPPPTGLMEMPQLPISREVSIYLYHRHFSVDAITMILNTVSISRACVPSGAAFILHFCIFSQDDTFTPQQKWHRR